MYKSWAFTIRPRNGFPKTLDDKVIDWAKRQDGAFLCFEKDGIERHIHGQIWTDIPREKGTVNRSIERLCANHIDEWDTAQSVVLRRGTKIAYNDDYITEYLSKEDNILYNNPPEDTSLYYPTQEEQDKVIRKSNAVDTHYHQMNEDLKEYMEKHEITKITTKFQVATFLNDMIYISKKYKVIKQKKDRTDLCNNLYYYHIQSKNSWTEFIHKEDIHKYQDVMM